MLSIRKLQEVANVCQGAFSTWFHKYSECFLKKKSICMGIDCWELFSRLCWTLLMSDALNGALLLFPGTSCSLRDDSTQLQLHTPPQPPKPFTIFSHPPLHIPAVAVLGLFFVSPLFFSLHTWRAELDRPSSLPSSWPYRAWASSCSPQQQRTLSLSCYWFNAVKDHTFEHMLR